MLIKVELFGDKLGVDNNLVEAILQKQFSVLLSFKCEKFSHEFILTQAEVSSLAAQIRGALAQAEELEIED